MKIQNIAYYNKVLDWRLEPVSFSDEFSNLALLVGVSGVGKTQILKSILSLKEIANGGSLNGVQWDITFVNTNNVKYRWKGEFENQEMLNNRDDENNENQYKILEEHLYKDRDKIVKRIKSQTEFKGQRTPKLSPFISIVEILSEEEDIAPVKDEFEKIIELKNEINVIDTLLKGYKNFSLEEIQKNNFPTPIKLALVYDSIPDIFQKIKKHFMDIFSHVEDIKLEKYIVGYNNQEANLIYIKEKGVDKWIVQGHISSGMFKALMYISELYLAPEGSVILIDEFENSLGINCIDILTEDLLQHRNLQFIITSHHPYIINNIGIEHWKIVTRKGGVVTVKDAKDLNLGKSRHQAFIQLLNLEAYSEGIEVE